MYEITRENRKGFWGMITSLPRTLRGTKKAFELADSIPNKGAFVLSRCLICFRYCRASNGYFSMLQESQHFRGGKVSLKPSVRIMGWEWGGGVAGWGQNKDFVPQGFSLWKPPAANIQQGACVQEAELTVCMPLSHPTHGKCSVC